MSSSFAHKKSHLEEGKIYYSKTEQCYIDRRGRYYFDHNTTKVYLNADESSDKKYYLDDSHKRYFYDHKGAKHYSKKADKKCYQEEESTCDDYKTACMEEESTCDDYKTACIEEDKCKKDKCRKEVCPLYGVVDVETLDSAAYDNDVYGLGRCQSDNWFDRSAYVNSSYAYPGSVQDSIAKFQFYNRRFGGCGFYYPANRVYGFRPFGYQAQVF